MTMTLDRPLTLEQDQQAEDDDDVCHAVCCEPDVAICGADVAGASWVSDDDWYDEPVTCIDCAAITHGMVSWACRYCGDKWNE